MAINGLYATQLDNGLRVLLKESHVAPVAAFWVFYRVGSRNEVSGITGISHWVEHMLFKGTEQFPRGEFDKAVARAGGVSNGMTSSDWTTYFETLPAGRIDLALQFESDRMAHAVFADAEIEGERTVILSEREGAENSYFWLLNEEVRAAAYRVHSYHHPTIGWRSDLLSMQRDDLYRHYRTFYAPNNAVVVAAGDFATAEMLAKLEHYFGVLPAGPPAPAMTLVEPEQQAERRVILRGSDRTAYSMHAFHGVAATHPDFFPLIVTDAVLSGAKGMGIFGDAGNSRSNRLYRSLVDSDLAVAVSSNFRPALDPDLFSFYVTLTPDTTHAQIEEVIWREIGKLQQEGVRADELHKAIKQTKAQFAYSSESVTYQGYWLGFSDIVAGLDWLDSWLDRLSAVTSDDVRRVAQHYFAPNKQTVGWYIPD